MTVNRAAFLMPVGARREHCLMIELASVGVSSSTG